MSIHILDHALAKHHITTLRDKKTEADQFRRLLRRLTTLLVAEATKNLAIGLGRAATGMICGMKANLHKFSTTE